MARERNPIYGTHLDWIVKTILLDGFFSTIWSETADRSQPDVSVTARHDARRASGDAYRTLPEVGEDEIPADLLSHLAKKPPQNPHTAAKA